MSHRISPPARLVLLLFAAAMAAFAATGSAIPGFSDTAARSLSAVAAAILVTFVVSSRVWNRPGWAHWLTVFLVGYFLARGGLSVLAGGEQRIGVMLIWTAAAVVIALILEPTQNGRL